MRIKKLLRLASAYIGQIHQDYLGSELQVGKNSSVMRYLAIISDKGHPFICAKKVKTK